MFQPGGIQTSGNFNFFPTTVELIALAFSRVRVKRTEITETHLQDALLEFNLFMATFNDLGPNLAQVDQQSVSLVQGTATYNVPVETVTILDMYIGSGSPRIDRTVWPISRTEYDAIPNKTQQGFPNQYWFDRLQAPTITLYFVPDGGGPYTLFYHRFRQVQDTTIVGALNPEVPNRAIDVLVAGLAHRLSRHYAPDLEAKREMDAEKAFAIYAKQDTENVPLYIQPATAGYWRV